MLAVDRNNPRVAKYFSYTNPAVLHEIQRAVSVCRQHKVPVSLCGEMAADPVAAYLLIGMGITSLSMSASKLLRLKHMIRNISYAQSRDVLDHCMTIGDAESIRHHVEQVLTENQIPIDMIH